MFTSFALGVLGGLLSGVAVYLVRQRVRADRLRKAIATEIRKSTPIDTVKTALMGEEALKTPIIDSNLDKIYLLSQHEVGLVANYHRHMSQVRAINKRESDDETVHIPAQMQQSGGDIANLTAETLETNIWVGTRIWNRIKSRAYNLVYQKDDEPIITEEEADKQAKELIEKTRENYESSSDVTEEDKS